MNDQIVAHDVGREEGGQPGLVRLCDRWINPAEIARQRPDDAFGRDPQHHQKQDSDEQQPILGEIRQQFRQQDRHSRADQRTQHEAGATDHDREQEQDRLRERERVRSDEHHQGREDRARKPCEQRRDGKGGRLDRDGIEPDGLSGRFAVAHRDHRAAPSARRKPPEPIERKTREQDRKERRLALRKGELGDGGRCESHQAILSAGDTLPFDGAVLNDEGKGDGDHGQIGPGDPQRRQGQERTDHSGSQPGCREGQPIAHAFEGQNRDRVGSDGIEAHMPQRHLPGETEQNVQSDADHHRQGEQRDDEVRIAFGDEHQHGAGDGQRQNCQCHRPGCGPSHRQTFFAAARPNSPFGIAASARMTTVNAMICV